MRCQVNGCPRKVHGGGFCQAHYKRWRKSGDAGSHEIRPQPKGISHGTISAYTNLGCRCDPCMEAKRVYSAKWKSDNPTYHRDNWLRRKYDLTPEQYDEMLAEQGGGCAICGSDEPGRDGHTRLAVDHDHDTGQVRGLLCDFCNKGLGQFKDQPETLRAAADYLERVEAPA